MPVSAYLKAGSFVVGAAVALFAAAGTVAIPSFWAYLAIFAVVIIVSFATLLEFVSQRHHSADPEPLALGSRHLVANALRSDLSLELRKREQHVQSESAHRRRRVELLGHRDERHPVRIEQLDELGEVSERAGQDAIRSARLLPVPMSGWHPTMINRNAEWHSN